MKRARAGLIGVPLWQSYMYVVRSRRRTAVVGTWNARLASFGRSSAFGVGLAAGLIDVGGRCESLFWSPLLGGGGSAACFPTNNGTRRRCLRADQARGSCIR